MNRNLVLAAVMVTLAVSPSLADNRTAIMIGNDNKMLVLSSEKAKWDNLTTYEKVVGAALTEGLKIFAKTRPTRGSLFPVEYCVTKTNRVFSNQLLALLESEARYWGIRLTYLDSIAMSEYVRPRDFGDPCFATHRVLKFLKGLDREHTIETFSMAKFNLCEGALLRVKIINGIPVITNSVKKITC
jgi:hypothetical protein